MNGFKLGRVSAYREYCAALRHLTLGSAVYFPTAITDAVCSYYNPSEEEHFIQVLGTLHVSGKISTNQVQDLIVTLDPWICTTIFSTQNVLVLTFPPADRMIEEFDADGFVDKISWHLPYIVRSIKGYYCDWNMDTCEYKAEQLAVGFLKSYIATAKEQTESL